MLRRLVIFSVCAGTSASVPIVYQSSPEAVMYYLSSMMSSPQAPETVQLVLSKPVAPESSARASTTSDTGSRQVTIGRDDRGHFNGDFRLNGRRITALIDTGATAVALNLSDARRIGIPVTQSDLTTMVDTANGGARATIVTIARMDIGRITVNQVEAVVLEDTALQGTLVGMSFLNRLRKFQVDGSQMLLVQ